MAGMGQALLLCTALQSATEDMVAHIFRSFPGMEYCDLKRDRITGQSKVLAHPSCLVLHALLSPQSCVSNRPVPLWLCAVLKSGEGTA